MVKSDEIVIRYIVEDRSIEDRYIVSREKGALVDISHPIFIHLPRRKPNKH